MRVDPTVVRLRVTRDQCVIDYAAAWEAELVYDTIICILTVAKTWKGRRGIPGKRIVFSQLMLRDGRSFSFSLYLLLT